MTAPWLLACASVGGSLGVLPVDEADETRDCLRLLRAWAKGDASVDLVYLRRRLWLQRNWLWSDAKQARHDPKAPRGSYGEAFRRYLVSHYALGLAQAALEPEYVEAAIYDALSLGHWIGESLRHNAAAGVDVARVAAWVTRNSGEFAS